MILPHFEVLEPTTVEEACGLLDEHGARARLLANGTDLLVTMKKRTLFDAHPPPRAGERFVGQGHPLAGPEAPEILVSLGRIPGFDGIEQRDDGRVAIGPMATMATLERSALLRERYTALAQGAGYVGAPTIRNRATIGGNLCHARPAADTAPPCYVLAAELVARSTAGTRAIAADEFFLAPGRSALRPGEVVEAVVLPAQAPYQGSAYEKLINRATLEISIVGVAASLTLDAPGGAITAARIALGAVGPTPLRAHAVEAALVGRTLGEALDAATAAAVTDARPIDDHRGSAAFRRDAVATLTRRALLAAHRRASLRRPGGTDA